MANPAPLHEVLESRETVQRLLNNMFSVEAPSDVVVVNGIAVLLNMLRERCVCVWGGAGLVGSIWNVLKCDLVNWQFFLNCSPPPMEFGVIPSISDSMTGENTPSPGETTPTDLFVCVSDMCV